MTEKSIYLHFPLIVLVLGTRDVKSSFITIILTSILIFTTFVFKKLLKSENLFFIRFFLFTLQIVLISFVLDLFNFEWYLATKYAVIMLFSIYIVIERIKISGKLTKIGYIIETGLLIVLIGFLRELFSFGSVAGVKLVNNFEGVLAFNYSSGGLLLAVLILAVLNHFRNKEVRNVKRDI